MTVDEFLLDKRTIFVLGNINNEVSVNTVMRILFLESQKPGQEISLYINSKGGSELDTLAIIDCINHVSSSIATYAFGNCGGSASLLLASGCKGKRYSLENAQIHMKQPIGSIGGQESDIQILTNQAIKIKDKFNLMFANATGKTVQEIEDTYDRDRFFTAQEAKEFGIIDHVATPKKKK